MDHLQQAMDAALVDRLVALPTFREAPRSELEWLAHRAVVHSWCAGEQIIDYGQPVDEMYVVLRGHVVFYTEHGGRRRHLYDLEVGYVAGMLPFSRVRTSAGVGYVEEDADILTLNREHFPELIRECPHVTTLCVHLMLERVRINVWNDLHDEKMASLGRLSAGLTHELNNPASAAARSSKLLAETLAAVETTTAALATLEPHHREAVAQARERALEDRLAPRPTAVEEAERRDALSEWLSARNVEDSVATELSETQLEVETLDSLEQVMSAPQLMVGLRWLAATCAARLLAAEIGHATTRIHEVVSAVKRFTYMDRAVAPGPVAVGQGIRDSATMLAAKAHARSITIDIKLPAELPLVHGYGDELNQVWLSLLDNALDAASSHVTISAMATGGLLLIRVADDGAGIPADVQPHVFEPFFTTKPIGQALGLGLDMVHRIVQRHEGEVSFVTRKGDTEFCVILPHTVE